MVELMHVRKIKSFLKRGLKIDEGFDWFSVCCIDPPHYRLYLTCDVSDWWRGINIERRQRTNTKGPWFAG